MAKHRITPELLQTLTEQPGKTNSPLWKRVMAWVESN